MKAAKKKYGDGAKEYALALREHSGLTYAEIAKETGLKEGYIRKLVFQKNTAKVTEKPEKVTPETLPVTPECNGVAHEVAEEKTAKNAEEMQILPKTGVTKPCAFAQHFGLMDLAFYVLNGTACFAMWDTAPGVVGASMATIYCLFSLDAILRVKRADMPNTAAAAANRVIFLEVIAAIFHFRLIERYLWDNLDKLPFPVVRKVDGFTTIRNEAGEIAYLWEWHNAGWVTFLAAVCAFMMSAAACHAVFFAKSAAKEAAKK